MTVNCCPECKSELDMKKTIVSQQIPHQEHWHYLVCEKCNNVLKGKIINNAIVAVLPTPNKKGFNTHRMMKQAIKLFKQNGHSVLSYSIDKDTEKLNAKDNGVLNRLKQFAHDVF